MYTRHMRRNPGILRSPLSSLPGAMSPRRASTTPEYGSDVTSPFQPGTNGAYGSVLIAQQSCSEPLVDPHAERAGARCLGNLSRDATPVATPPFFWVTYVQERARWRILYE